MSIFSTPLWQVQCTPELEEHLLQTQPPIRQWSARETRTQERQVIAAMRKGQKHNPKLPTGEHSFPGLGAPTACQPLSGPTTVKHKVPWNPG